MPRFRIFKNVSGSWTTYLFVDSSDVPSYVSGHPSWEAAVSNVRMAQANGFFVGYPTVAETMRQAVTRNVRTSR